MKIGNFDLNQDGVYIIAELSANHNGSLQTALDTIKAAKEIGANAIKLQTYTADSMTLNVDRDEFIASGLWEGQKLYDLYEQAQTPEAWHQELFDYARSLGIDIFSTPFDIKAADFLEQFNPSAYKIASFEITDYSLIAHVAKKQKPIVISTGIAKEEEIYDVVQICKDAGNSNIILLKCTSEYPAPLEEANLLTIPNMKEKFGVEVGFSDHTMGITAPIIATTLGAKVIEKHFILDKSIGGPDSGFSLDKNEFSELIKAVRESEKLIGKVDYSMGERKLKSRHYGRSLYVSKDIKEGEAFSLENVKSVRPALGLHPKHLNNLLGQIAKKDYNLGDALSLDDIKQ